MERIIGIESPSVNSADATAEYGSAYVNYAKKMLDGDAKTLSSVRLACCHLLARLIARERGYDKGQSDKAIGKAVIEGLIHKPIIYHDEKTDDDDIDVKVIDVKDPNWQKALYKVENELMLQSVMEEITDPTEKLVIRVYKEAQRTSLQEAFDWFSIQCSESGLNTLNSVSQRFTRLKTKYPELSKFNPFHD